MQRKRKFSVPKLSKKSHGFDGKAVNKVNQNNDKNIICTLPIPVRPHKINSPFWVYRNEKGVQKCQIIGSWFWLSLIYMHPQPRLTGLGRKQWACIRALGLCHAWPRPAVAAQFFFFLSSPLLIHGGLLCITFRLSVRLSVCDWKIIHWTKNKKSLDKN